VSDDFILEEVLVWGRVDTFEVAYDVFSMAGGPVFIGGRGGGLDMAAGFVCNLGWWFGRDYGLVRGDGVILELVTNRGGANVLLLPVFFGAGNR
jgi:hypothetical protein